MSESEAIARLVNDGDTVYAGYTSVAFGLCHEIIRQGKKNLEIVGGSIGPQSTQMFLAGCVDRVSTGYISGALRPGPIQDAMDSGELKYEDYSNQAIALMLMAGALGIPFIPTRSFLGTDYLDDRVRDHPNGYLREKKWATMTSPFDDQQVVLLPAIKPDVAVLHAHRADRFGNVQLWGHTGDARWAYWAAKKPIVSVEEIVEPEVIREDPGRTVVPGFKVAAVVHMPWGAHPTPMVGHYDSDYGFQAKVMSRVARSREGYDEFAAEWIHAAGDRAGYVRHFIDTFGQEALDALRTDAGPSPQDGVSYGHSTNLRFRM